MDTQEDFQFLQEHIAEKFNPLQEGEYIVIQTRTGSWRLNPLLRTFSYWQADRFAQQENMGSDYSHYSVRIVCNAKLYCVDSSSYPTEISKEQDWHVHQEYYNARYVENRDVEIESCCECGYPVFWSWRNVPGAGGQIIRDWRAVTCIVEDYGREVIHCPNCRFPLLADSEDTDPENEDDLWFGWDHSLELCEGCKFFNYSDQIPCAVHPLGVETGTCPDYSSEPPF